MMLIMMTDYLIQIFVWFANFSSLLPHAVPTLFNYTNPYNTVTQGCMGPRRTVVQGDRRMFDSKGKTIVDHSYATNGVVDRNLGKPQGV